jgi:iron-sulfur cluster assembly protein
MLTLTERAVEIVRLMAEQINAPREAGLRIAWGMPLEDALIVGMAAGPEPHDDVIVTDGSRIFVDGLLVLREDEL